MEATCVHCHRPIEGYKSPSGDTAAGPSHFVCALRWAMDEPARAKAAARDEALRAEGARQGERRATDAAVQMMREMAHLYGRDILPSLFERALERLERGEHLKESP